MMRAGVRRHVAHAWALALFLAAVMVPVAALGEPWVEVVSPHLVVVSDAGKGEAQRIAVHFERIRAAIKALWPWARVDAPVPLKILATRGEDGLKVLIPEFWKGKNRAHPAGVFQQGFARPWIALRADLAEPGPGSDSPYHLIQHEYLHLVIHLNFERVPLWLDEGMAELFGGTAVRGNGVALGRPIAGHLRLLRDRKLLPVESLFLVNRRSPEYTEQNRTNLFYAESWALVHYLMLDPKASHDAGFKGFMGEVVEGMEPMAALRAQGLSAAEVDQGLAGYVRRLAYWKATLPTPIADAEGFTTREVSAAEWSADCGAFLVDHGRVADGRRLLDQAERQQPDLAVVQEGLGVALLRDKQLEEARDRLERASHLDTVRPTAHFLAAWATLQMASTVQTRADARAHLERAIQLAPEYDLAHALLAEALLADGDVPRAVEHASRAASLAPGSGPHRLTLARAFIAAEHVSDGEAQARKAVDLGLNDSQNKAAWALLESSEGQSTREGDGSSQAGVTAGSSGTPRLHPAPGATAPTGRIAAWGVFVDEDGKSSIEVSGGRVEISVPAGAYDLGAEIGNVSAPRLLRPVEGDFVAQVTVSRAPQPAEIRGSARRVPFDGAGLLLWLDERNYVRLEFAASVAAGGATTRYPLFQQRRNGLAVGGLAKAHTHLDAAPATLRLERHDRSLLGFVRQGEGEWTPVGRFEADMPSQIYLGVAAVNTTRAPFVAAFEAFTVSPAP
jgi:tetratricopeptide (TPR) repeat protein/regulation of enolase protein 1 (concanavalin A-like superfamily)